MKLPPLALTAPSLCPRCDAPAMFIEECTQCALPLRQCASCLGVAGPFDRYCGFCGHELLLGRRRAPGRRIWLLAGLLPILIALGLGLSPVGQSAVRGVTGTTSPNRPAVAHRNLSNHTLGFSAASPAGWAYAPPTGGGSIAALTSDSADVAIAAGAPATLVTSSPKGAVVLLGRPESPVSGVDPTDPVAVLAAQTAQLTAAPPAGVTFTTVTPVEQRTIAGRRAAYSSLSVVGPDGTARLFERVYISSARGLFLVEGLFAPNAAPAFQSLLGSLQLS